MFFLWLLCATAVQVVASPQVALPFNAQVPPVARANQPYSFAFALSTFTPIGGIQSYNLADAPEWLKLDSASRILYGLPKTGDEGTATFTIAASDGQGSTRMACTMAVVSEAPPQLVADISEQLAKSANLSAPGVVTMKPTTPFRFSLSPGTFISAGSKLFHSATMADNTPLPAWLDFNPITLEFTGSTPLSTNIPQRYDIMVSASTVAGFAGASVKFTVVVSDHQLFFRSLANVVPVGPGESVNITFLKDQLLSDGTPATAADIAIATSSAPTWLNFDPRTLVLTGKPPSTVGAQNVNTTVNVVGRFGNTATTTVQIHIMEGLFGGQIGSLSATAGRPFEYTINRSLLIPLDVAASIDFGPASSFLAFDATNLRISGTIPSSTPAQTIHALLKVVDTSSLTNDSQSFEIAIANPTIGSPSSPDSTRGSTLTSRSATVSPGGRARGSGSSAGVIAGSAIASTFGLLCIILLCWCCRCRRRPRRQEGTDLKGSISRPLSPATFDQSVQDEPPDMEKGSLEYERSIPPPLRSHPAFAPRNSFQRPSKSEVLPSSWGIGNDAFLGEENGLHTDSFGALSRSSMAVTQRRELRNGGEVIARDFGLHELPDCAIPMEPVPRPIKTPSHPSRDLDRQSEPAPETPVRPLSSLQTSSLPSRQPLAVIEHSSAPANSKNISTHYAAPTLRDPARPLTTPTRYYEASAGVYKVFRRSRGSSQSSLPRSSLNSRAGVIRPVPRRPSDCSPFFAGRYSGACWTPPTGAENEGELSAITGSQDLSHDEDDKENRIVFPGQTPSTTGQQGKHIHRPTLFAEYSREFPMPSPYKAKIKRPSSQNSYRSWVTSHSSHEKTRSVSSEVISPFDTPRPESTVFGHHLAVMGSMGSPRGAHDQGGWPDRFRDLDVPPPKKALPALPSKPNRAPARYSSPFAGQGSDDDSYATTPGNSLDPSSARVGRAQIVSVSSLYSLDSSMARGSSSRGTSPLGPIRKLESGAKSTTSRPGTAPSVRPLSLKRPMTAGRPLTSTGPASSPSSKEIVATNPRATLVDTKRRSLSSNNDKSQKRLSREAIRGLGAAARRAANQVKRLSGSKPSWTETSVAAVEKTTADRSKTSSNANSIMNRPRSSYRQDLETNQPNASVHRRHSAQQRSPPQKPRSRPPLSDIDYALPPRIPSRRLVRDPTTPTRSSYPSGGLRATYQLQGQWPEGQQQHQQQQGVRPRLVAGRGRRPVSFEGSRRRRAGSLVGSLHGGGTPSEAARGEELESSGIAFL